MAGNAALVPRQTASSRSRATDRPAIGSCHRQSGVKLLIAGDAARQSALGGSLPHRCRRTRGLVFRERLVGAQYSGKSGKWTTVVTAGRLSIGRGRRRLG